MCRGRSRYRCRSDAAAGLRTRVAALERATLVLAHAAPHAGILAGLQRPAQALGGHRATVADELRISDLREGRAAVPHGEEQFRILVATDRLVTPIHSFQLLVRSLPVRHKDALAFSSAVNACT